MRLEYGMILACRAQKLARHDRHNTNETPTAITHDPVIHAHNGTISYHIFSDGAEAFTSENVSFPNASVLDNTIFELESDPVDEIAPLDDSAVTELEAAMAELESAMTELESAALELMTFPLLDSATPVLLAASYITPGSEYVKETWPAALFVGPSYRRIYCAVGLPGFVRIIPVKVV
jgi:hypothetical protein